MLVRAEAGTSTVAPRFLGYLNTYFAPSTCIVIAKAGSETDTVFTISIVFKATML
jgi:hypothetical protein